MALSLEQVLNSSNSRASSNAEQRPRVHKFGEAWPEAVLLSAVLLEFKVLVGVILRVTLPLIFFVLPAVCQQLRETVYDIEVRAYLSPPIPRRNR